MWWPPAAVAAPGGGGQTSRWATTNKATTAAIRGQAARTIQDPYTVGSWGWAGAWPGSARYFQAKIGIALWNSFAQGFWGELATSGIRISATTVVTIAAA